MTLSIWLQARFPSSRPEAHSAAQPSMVCAPAAATSWLKASTITSKARAAWRSAARSMRSGRRQHLDLSGRDRRISRDYARLQRRIWQSWRICDRHSSEERHQQMARLAVRVQPHSGLGGERLVLECRCRIHGIALRTTWFATSLADRSAARSSRIRLSSTPALKNIACAQSRPSVGSAITQQFLNFVNSGQLATFVNNAAPVTPLRAGAPDSDFARAGLHERLAKFPQAMPIVIQPLAILRRDCRTRSVHQFRRVGGSQLRRGIDWAIILFLFTVRPPSRISRPLDQFRLSVKFDHNFSS